MSFLVHYFVVFKAEGSCTFCDVQPLHSVVGLVTTLNLASSGCPTASIKVYQEAQLCNKAEYWEEVSRMGVGALACAD